MTATGSTPAHPWTSTTTRVIAHRGASADAPENTLAAVERAIDDGSAVVECDVQRTADGELVVLHDATLARTTDAGSVFPRRKPWNVADLTLDQVRRLDAGAWFGAEFAGQRVPTLREWIDAIGTRAGMLIEVKHPDRKPGIENDLAETLRASQWARRALHDGRLVVQSFDHDWLRHAYAPLGDGVPLGALCLARPSSRQVRAISEWADQLNPRLGATDRALVDAAHECGLSINVWTVNGTTDMRRLIDARVDGIITNKPAKLAALARKHGGLTVGA
ncbi:glycerophosphodiester phosphodiesterase family protein [Naumannella cuiyingiana]|uniref:Glycerophosphoryl diester phosphodiesterase n=1 Tax=Naumannella cuiyingiana TaxID=1347891 RepID=A0A7Z0IL76_9ACTN|nr:glycerophosphoryl diester phosphodiesterase [Naumannella cuiyingiana]